MSLAVSQLISDFRLSIDDSVFPTATDALRLLNRARQEVAKKAQCFEEIKSTSSTNTTNKYALTSDVYQVRMIDMMDYNSRAVRIDPVNKAEWDSMSFENSYDYYRWYFLDGRNVWFAPRLTSSADATAINAVGGINASVTTITVDDTGSFPQVGKIKIDNEVIYYYGKTSTTFTNCVRGREGTTATTHADDAVVTHNDITIYYYKLPTDSLTTSSNVDDVFEQYPNVLIYWMAWQAKIKDMDDVQGTGSSNMAMFFYQQWNEAMAEFTRWLRGSADQYRVIQQVH